MAEPVEPRTVTEENEPPNGMQRWAEAPRHRGFVGAPWKYDLIAAMQFNLLTTHGLREHHYLLDIGCGSLRAGRLFIPYLRPGHYHGIEPERWLVEDGIRVELGEDAIRIKQPRFLHRDDFRLTAFERSFDYMVAHSIFTHATQDQVRTCLGEAAQALASDGILAATYIPADSDFEGAEWSRRAFYRPESIVSWAADAGLAVEFLDWPHPNVRQQWFLARRSA